MAHTLTDRAYHNLRQRLHAGLMPVGYRLSDRDLSREMGMSRTPVRQAIVRMQDEGLVEPHPSGGYRVSRPTSSQLQELFELREVIEPQAGRLAAQRITSEQLDELQAICQDLRRFAQAVRDLKLRVLDGEISRRINELDMRFHLIILRASGNRELVEMVKRHRMFSRIFGYHQHPTSVEPFRMVAWNIYRWHVRIVRALSRHEADRTAHLLREHMRDARQAQRQEHDVVERQLADPDWPTSFTDSMTSMESDESQVF